MAAATLSYEDLGLIQGDGWLFRHLDLYVRPRDRLALIGRNGAGKTTLLKCLVGLIDPDEGRRTNVPGAKVVLLEQDPAMAGQTLEDWVLSGRDAPAPHQAAAIADQVGLDLSRPVATASGGERRRAAIVRALAQEPDVLLLDEPTNHLDLDSIAWLEELLRNFNGSVMVVTHDRAFLDGVATRILELDRGTIRSYPGNFSAYERIKEEQLAADALAGARADKLLAQEEIWVRKGVEARRTRSVARIERLQKLRAQRRARRESLGQVRLEIDSGIPSGKIVAELRDVTMTFADRAAKKTVVQGFSATILRGDKVGVIGPNGAGKTTLLKLILGELEPTSGSVRQGTRLEVAYFDQMRSTLDLDRTLADTISPGSEWVEIDGAKKHVMSYLNDFLFAPERANSPVRTLSGGERNRVLLARLFALPANVLVLDEPTNDLDIDTLELLEERLQGYAGTVFLVSHDRRFLDNVVTSTIAWEGDESPALWREYEGGYEDWKTQRERALALREQAARSAAPGRGKAAAAPPPVPAPAPKPRKLSYKEQREFDGLPDRIDALEAEQRALGALLADASIYAKDPDRAAAAQARHAQIDAELLRALERWEELGSRAGPATSTASPA
jgi:ATP-binding cassette subfamily F protein uup